MAVLIDPKCIGCGACISNCPEDALEIGPDGKVTVNADKCKECNKCTGACPVEALALPPDSKVAQALAKKKAAQEAAKNPPIKAEAEIKTEYLEKNTEETPKVAAEAPPELAAYKGVWVFAEHLESKLAGVTLELLGRGRFLADKLGVDLSAVLLGNGVENLASTLFEYGADKVYLMDEPVYHFYRAETYLKGFTYLIEKYKPEVLLMGATTTGRDLAGAVATQLKTGLTADCTELDIDLDKRILLASRPAFGGNIMATILCENHRPQMATVRPKVMKACAPTPGKVGQVTKEKIEINEESLLTKVLNIVREQGDNVRIDEAEIVVCGGRGLGDKKGFDMLYDLADVLGGVVGGTRAAVEAGWIEHNRQIGQTGVTVAPKIFFSIASSGAVQHIVGMEKSDTVIAINTNPDCPMMKLATYGVVGDAFEIVPKFTSELRKILGKPEPKTYAKESVQNG